MRQIKVVCHNFISWMLVMFLFVGALGIHSSAAKGTNMLGNCEPYFITNASLENFSMGGTEYKNGFKCRVAYDRHCELAFNLGQNYTSVSFDVGHIDGTAAGSSEIKLTILGDGEELRILPLNNEDIPQSVTLDVSGISQLTFLWSSRYYDSYFGIAALNFTGKGWSADQKTKESNMLYNCEPYNSKNCSVEDFSMGHINYKDGFKFRVAYDRTGRADFNFGGNYKSITFDVGHIDGTAAGSSNIVLNILVGTETYMSLPLNNEDIPKTVTVPLDGVHQFSFVWSSKYYDSYFGISGIQLKSNGIVRGIELEQETLDLSYNNATSYVKAHVVPNDATNTNIKWSSSDVNIATVNAEGLVTAIGNGTTTITATTVDGNFSALCTVNVSGMPIHVSRTDIQVGNGTYIGSAITPEVVVTYNGKKLKQGTDYGIAYSNNVNAGTATVTITGIGSYTGTATKNFTIAKADQFITASVRKNTLVAGKTTQISVTGQGNITYSGTTNAAVSASGLITAKKAGKAVITIKADGGNNYNAASTTLTITVNPAAPKITSVKNTGKGQVTIKWAKVSGVNGYEIKYKAGSSSKTTTVKKAAVTKKVIKKLKKGKTYKFYVRSYRKTGGQKYYSAWSKVKKVKIRK